MSATMNASVLAVGLLLAPQAAGAGGGVLFDRARWYHSHDPNRLLRVDDKGHLVWRSRKPHQLVARLPRPQPVGRTGDVAEVSYLWKSSGQVIGPDCKKTLRHDDCVICLAGTGDFRVGLFESSGRYVTRDGIGLESDVFKGWKGYQWRFSPHLQPREVKRWWEPKPDGSRESHTNLRFWKRTDGGVRRLLSKKGGL